MRARILGRRAELVFVAAIVAVVGAIAVYAFTHGPVDAGSLRKSVERESGSANGFVTRGGWCRERGPGRWRCEVVDSGSSGLAGYAIRMRDGSCWTGKLAGFVGEPMPRRISGCVLLRD